MKARIHKILQKRMIAFALVVAMAVTLMPGMSLKVEAAEYNIWIGDTRIDGSYASEQSLFGGTVTYDDSTKTLTLNGVNITTGSADGKIGIKAEQDLNIVLKGENVIGNATDWNDDAADPDSSIEADAFDVHYGIVADGYNLTFLSDPYAASKKLTIYDYAQGISAETVNFGSADSVFLGTVTIKDYGGYPPSGGGDGACAIHANDKVSIYGGSFDLTSTQSDGIYALNDVSINSAGYGEVTISGSRAIQSIAGDIKIINDSRVTAKEGTINTDDGDVTINKSEVTIQNDGLAAAGTGKITISNHSIVDINTGTSYSDSGISGVEVDIKDSKVTAKSLNEDDGEKGIDASDKIIISGKSTVYAEGKDYGIYCDPDELAVSNVSLCVDGGGEYSINAKGGIYAIFASSTEGGKPLTIGDAGVYPDVKAKVMRITNAKPMVYDRYDESNDKHILKKGTEQITESSGPLDINVYYNDWDGDTRHYASILASDDDNNYVVIGFKEEADPKPNGGEDPGNDNPPPRPILPPTPEIKVDGDGSIDVEGTVSGNKVTVGEITKDALEEIVEDNSKNTSISIDLSGNKGVTTAVLSKDSVETISDVLSDKTNSKSEFVITTTTAEVSIDATALASIASQAKGDDIQIVVENTEDSKLNATQKEQLESLNTDNKSVEMTFEAYFVSGGVRISNFNGGEIRIVKIDHTIPSGMNEKYVHVFYIPENGAAERHTTWVEDRNPCFITTHCSDFAIVYDETIENGKPENPDSTVIITRMYNPNSGDHFYTTGKEVNSANNTGWKIEAKSYFKLNGTGNKIYRAFHPVSGDHFYTANKAEWEYSAKYGYNLEGIAFTSSKSGKQILRMYNPLNGDHFYTTSAAEAKSAEKLGYRYEGVAFYVN